MNIISAILAGLGLVIGSSIIIGIIDVWFPHWFPTGYPHFRLLLGDELRLLRETADLGIDHVEVGLGWSTGKVFRLEAGLSRVKLNDIRKMASMYGLSEREKAILLHRARHAQLYR